MSRHYVSSHVLKVIAERNLLYPKGVDFVHPFTARNHNEVCQVCAQMSWHRLHW